MSKYTLVMSRISLMYFSKFLVCLCYVSISNRKEKDRGKTQELFGPQSKELPSKAMGHFLYLDSRLGGL